MRPFDYLEPTSVAEVLAATSEHGPNARLLAGGQTLLILMRMRLTTPSVVVALGSVDDLHGITQQADGSLHVGAMTSYREVATSALVADHSPLLAQAAATVGSMHIRELGTMGGSICHADPAADVPAALMALDATYVVATVDGSRTFASDSFVTGLMETRLPDGSVLTGVHVPRSSAGSGVGFERFTMRDGEYPMTQSAVLVRLVDGAVETMRLAVGGGGDRTQRLGDVEDWLVGTTPDARLLDELAKRVQRAVHPYADVRGSADWKAEVIGVMAKRALANALRAV
jgi:carbon-monoxide dehydrogenase medium subunit